MSKVHFRLTAVRAEHRLSQRQLAALAGIRPDTISDLERGESQGIQFDTLARLCEVLDCQPGDLLELDADRHRVPVLGGPDEDELLRQRLHELEAAPRIDGPTFIAELTRLAEEDDRRRKRR